MQNEKINLRKFLLELNRQRSAEFINPDTALHRRLYRARHSTEIAALKCMDGRLNLSVMTKTPPGIIQPFRNLGGIFELGWPYFGDLMRKFVDYAVKRGRDVIILVTYHYSKGDQHRGCKGFNYDTQAAQNFTHHLASEFEDVFGKNHSVVYPIQVGIETDDDALVLHGSGKGEALTLNLAELGNISEEELRIRVEQLFPDMQQHVVADLLPLLLGNLRHIEQVKKQHRPITDAEHKEQVLGIGRGFDWLHLPNKALIIGPYSYDMYEPIKNAGRILLDNIMKERIPKDQGIILFSSAVYRDEAGTELPWARKKAWSLADLAFKTLKQSVPDIFPYLDSIVGVVNLNTRAFTEIENLDFLK